MPDNPTISIIIPVYNVERFLHRCLDSVLNQTFQDWEAICVNDGSPDNSAAILNEYAARDARFKIITKENGGISDARNVGTAAARGKYILYLDSDDFIHLQLLEITHYLAEKNNADMVTFNYDTRFHKKLLRLMHMGRSPELLPDARNISYQPGRVRNYITDNILLHSTERNHSIRVRRPVRRHCFPVLCLYRRTLIADLPFIRGIIMEDFPWWSAVMLRRPKTVMTKLPLYFYMPNAGSILGSSKALRMIESIATGLGYVHNLYCANARPSEMKHYVREFLWPFAIIAMRKIKKLDNPLDIAVAARALGNLYDAGVFDNAPNMRARRYRRRIRKFVRSAL